MKVRFGAASPDPLSEGNPAAVCIVEAADWPQDAWMQQLAGELNAPMTAFARPRPDGDWDLRWFTPQIEERLCGHATLATAFLLRAEGLAGAAMRFHTLGGLLPATVARDGAVTLDFPAARPVVRSPIDGLAAALGASPAELFGTGELGDVLAIFDSEDAVRALAPRFDALAELTRRDG